MGKDLVAFMRLPNQVCFKFLCLHLYNPLTTLDPNYYYEVNLVLVPTLYFEVSQLWTMRAGMRKLSSTWQLLQ